MVLTRQFTVGVLLGLCLAACAGATFPYKYYGVDLKNQKLLGPTPQDDLDISVCSPGPDAQSNCIGMLQDVFFSMKQDYLDTKAQLIRCQQGQ